LLRFSELYLRAVMERIATEAAAPLPEPSSPGPGPLG
jgi:hypothetical protein